MCGGLKRLQRLSQSGTIHLLPFRVIDAKAKIFSPKEENLLRVQKNRGVGVSRTVGKVGPISTSKFTQRKQKKVKQIQSSSS